MAYGNNGGYNRYNNNPNRYQNNKPAAVGGNIMKKNADQTDGILFVNNQVGRFMRTRFWNRCMGIDIGSFPPGTQIDYDTIRNAQMFGHVFAFSTVFELETICEEVLESIKNTGRFESMATEAGQKKDVIVEISNGSNINMPGGIYLVIYKSVDAGRRTNLLEAYPFGATKVMTNYNHLTGASTEDIRATGDFKKFVMCLKEAAKALTMAQAHVIHDVHKNEKLATFNALAAIATGLGVDLGKLPDANRTTGQSTYSRKQQAQSYQRQSTPGQWNHNQYNPQPQQQQQRQPQPMNGYQQTQAALAAISDEPVDIALDVANLQNVTMDDFK